jgi:3-hydroxy-9,10-secoandrosta-1,3,5(10)-triene-9,17-dione monooxygenase reductase component
VTLNPEDPGDFRRALGALPTGVAVVSSIVTGRPAGVVVGSLGSVSLTPPLVGFFIAETSTTWPLIEPAGGFCASVLSAGQESLSRLFATRGADKFASCRWEAAPSGRPIIAAAAAWYDCEIEATIPAGDHKLVLGRVVATGCAEDRDPLVFLGGAYGRVATSGGDGTGRGEQS